MFLRVFVAFLNCCIVFLFMNKPPLSCCEYLDCVEFEANMNKAALNMLVQVFFCGLVFILLGNYLRVELLAQSIGICHITNAKWFSSVLAPLNAAMSNTRVSATPHPHQHLVLSGFYILADLLGVRQYFPVVLICIFMESFKHWNGLLPRDL